ncbi:HAMP domain-containing sensor histidine kinase [Mangrovicella endophytica]|uniref:HAMP domain-containing sensor histidine kinase n=1 Tax=Mangrovicella endophytica TaxID=2066697 RepID=UPI000C9E665F|nr:histidine kinase [Mangrovicella endophytica]
MSIRSRLLAAIIVALAAIVMIGGVLIHGHIQRKVATEIGAARHVASNRVTQLIGQLPAAADPTALLTAFVQAFNGDRHIQIMMIDAGGAVRMTSHPAKAAQAMPEWFYAAFAPHAGATVMPLSGSAAPIVAAVVAVDPRNELAEAWDEIWLLLALLGLFVAACFVLIYLVVGQALRPLGELSTAFQRIGGGDYATALAVRGAPELANLAASCNAMAVRLAEFDRNNRRLAEQLLRLQDEERAELARDLHDEVGPFVFAIDVDAGEIARLARSAGSSPGAVEERAIAIRQAARHVGLHVRRILGTLRPGTLPALGLKAALEGLVAELGLRHRDVTFRLDVADADRGPEAETLLHRVIREAVSNALRHARPTLIRIVVSDEADGSTRFAVTDDGGGFGAATNHGSGYGLIGMRERVEAAGGTLLVRPVALPPGVSIEGRLPAPAAEHLELAPALQGRAA